MPENTGAEPAAVTLRACVACGIRVIGGIAVTVIATTSGPENPLYACAGCVRHHNLLPLDEQETPYRDGRLQFRQA